MMIKPVEGDLKLEPTATPCSWTMNICKIKKLNYYYYLLASVDCTIPENRISIKTRWRRNNILRFSKRF